MRLNRFLAQSGVASRRQSDEIIFQGRVSVNGDIADSPGIQVEEQDDIRVDGERIHLKSKFMYIKMNKPQGYVTSVSDPHNEKIVMDLLPKVYTIVPVGRLDKDSTGILIFTDDGDLLHKLIHPKFGIEKEYEILLDFPPHGFPEKDLPNGIVLENGQKAKGICEPLNQKRTHYKLILKEGKKREIKRIFRLYNTKVRRLHRNFFAGISANDIAEGKWKRLTTDEINHLKAVTKSNL